MFRIIVPTIILVASVGLFVVFTNPNYQQISDLKVSRDAYDQALNNSKQLLAIRDQLKDKYNNLSESDKERLQKLMPDNVDNIRLIIDIQKIASQYGMNPKDIKFDARATAKNTTSGASQVVATPEEAAQDNKDYGSFDLEFSVTGTYQNFMSFLHDLENSLRIVDVGGITFQAADTGSTAIRYNVHIKTYWLKN